jgi:hypothetical protein
MGFAVKIYAEGLDKKEIFEKILHNQSNTKRFSIKASRDISFTEEGKEGKMSFLCDSFIDADFEQKTLHVRNNLKNTFLTSGKEESFPISREYYLSNDKLVGFNIAGHEYKWAKYNCKYSHFTEYIPTFWKAIELIRVGGFFDYKVKENFNPSLNDTMDHGLAGADKLDPIFPSTFSILFTGLSYNVLNITETNFKGVSCYQLNIKVSEDDLKRYFSENNQAYVYKLPELIINVFASKENHLLLALQYKLEAKFRGELFGQEEVDSNHFESGEYIYEYPESSLELPLEVKNAEDCEKTPSPK